MQIGNLLQQLLLQTPDLTGQIDQEQTVNGQKTVSPLTELSLLTQGIGSLEKGAVFEGTILNRKGTELLIGLADGTRFSARLAADLQLETGRNVSFEIKDSSDGLLTIRPIAINNQENSISVKVLEQAGIEVTPENLQLAGKMMEENLPVDKNSMNQMLRLVSANSGIATDVVVELKKLGLPITQETANQYENFKTDRQTLVPQLGKMVDQLPKILNLMSDDPKVVLQLIRDFTNTIDMGTSLPNTREELEQSSLQQEIFPNQEIEVSAEQEPDALPKEQQGNLKQEMILEKAVPMDTHQGEIVEKNQILPENSEPIMEQDKQQAAQDELQEITQQDTQQKIRETEVLPQDDKGNTIDHTNQGTRQWLQIADFLEEHKEELSGEEIKRLVSKPEFHKILSKMLEEQWVIRPEEGKLQEQVEKLYEKLDKEMAIFEKTMENMKNQPQSVMKDVQQIRQNLNFINEMNHLYQYVQLPLKLKGKQAHGELYVYQNRKKVHDPKEKLSASLYLDMEHLGKTEVQVELLYKHVTATFTMEQEDAFQLITEHLTTLKERLEEKGYEVTASAEHRQMMKEPAETILNQNQQNISTRRYSFDVRV